MTARNLASTSANDIAELMREIGRKARGAAAILAEASTETKNKALLGAADALMAETDQILEANQKDLEAGREKGLTTALLDRLALTPERIAAIADSLRQVAELDDPVGDVMAVWDRPNGLAISRVRVPLGVIGIIYESRPNVTADAGALCLKSGNAAILRGGSESFYSSSAIHACMVQGLTQAGLPEAAIQLVPTTDRQAVGEMLKGLDGAIDVIVPRGGKSLVARVQDEARAPVLGHLEGLCHTYVDAAADLDMATSIIVNAKMRRPGICGATETVLVDAASADSHLAPIADALIAAGCAIRGDEAAMARHNAITPADEDDWRTEYLAPVVSIRVVDGVEGAIAHIREYSSGHTDAIVTGNDATAARFLNAVDSAIVMHNASTQFADGGEFGMGAEIGIATGKLHARGPVGAEQLTSYKYIVHGTGQKRP